MKLVAKPAFQNQKHSLFTGEQAGWGPPAVGAILALVVGEVGRQDAQVDHRSDKARQAEWAILIPRRRGKEG